MKTLSTKTNEICLINPKELILNEEKLNVLGKCKNYDELFESIQEKGIITPLLVNESNIVISGNMRLKIALELNLENVPVNYVDVSETDIVTILHTDVSREKTLSEKLNIYFILTGEYKSSQGNRTDLFIEKKEQKDEFIKLNPLTEHTEKIVKKCLKNYTQEEVVGVVKELEQSKKSFKLPDVQKGLENGKSGSNPENGNKDSGEKFVFNDNFEITIDYNDLFEMKNLKQEVKSLNENGGSVFITNGYQDSDFKLIRRMLELGMMLFTLKEVSKGYFTYQFIFRKSSVSPVKKIEEKTVQLEHYDYRLTSGESPDVEIKNGVLDPIFLFVTTTVFYRHFKIFFN